MRYIRFDVVLQQNSLSAVCVVIVATLVRIDQGNGEIEDFCGESITSRQPGTQRPRHHCWFFKSLFSDTERFCSLRNFWSIFWLLWYIQWIYVPDSLSINLV